MRVLFATDFSRDAQTAEKLLMGMPLPSRSRIRVLYAVEPLNTIVSLGQAPIVDISDAAAEDARGELRKVEHTLRRSGVEIDYAVRLGRAADVIVDECSRFEADLIVMGNRGRGAFATNVLGSVSGEVIDRARVPVLVARRTTLMRMVLAEDGSPSAAAGARLIASYAPFANTAVHVVSVVDVPYPLILADPTGTSTAVQADADYRESVARTRIAREAQLAARVQALQEVGVTASGARREGDAAFELIEAAKEQNADCIVIGSRGTTGLRRLMLGSVARSVLYHAPCSVLITHAQPGAEDRRERHELTTVS